MVITTQYPLQQHILGCELVQFKSPFAIAFQVKALLSCQPKDTKKVEKDFNIKKKCFCLMKKSMGTKYNSIDLVYGIFDSCHVVDESFK